jgi:flavin reductase (DIM6/NTAB) family NADH-FMN oxidoreductase RutF
MGAKDTLRNVEQTGEFVWKLVTQDLAQGMSQTCAAVPPEVNEFELAGLAPVTSRLVSVPRVGESPVNFECRCKQIVQATHLAKIAFTDLTPRRVSTARLFPQSSMLVNWCYRW